MHDAGISPDLESALSFLGRLYRNTTGGGFINLFHINRSSGARATAWAQLDHIEELGASLLDFGSHGDVWFGVAPRREQLTEGRRGGVTDCLCIPAFWLDIDIASDQHKLPGLPESYEHGRQIVESFALPPSMVVRSGYGMQAWWLLSEELPAVNALTYLARWQLTWERLAGAVHIDNVSNLDRVMRLPGTFNWKGSGPVPVTFKAQQAVYEHAEILELLDALPDTSERKRTSTAHLAGSRFNNAVSVRTILLSIGCELVRTDSNGDEHYHYPGATNETSCTVYAEDEHCTIWSETMAAAYGFELRTPYHSFALRTYIVHGGDWSKAHEELINQGIADLAGLSERPVKQAKPVERLKVMVASMSTRERVKWIWYGWLPVGKLTILDGDPDVGKSTLSLDIAARVTTGARMPDGSDGIEPRDVILLSGEDDMEDTIIWRLLGAKADLSRVHHVQAALDDDGELPVTIPRDIGLVKDLVLRTQSALVIIDVLDAYLDERVDAHKNQSVRRVLQQVRLMAHDTGCAVIMLRHLRKEGSPKAIYRGGGSIGIVGAARAGWAMAYHPDDDSTRVLAAVKMNIAVKPQALTLKLMPHDEYPCAWVDWRESIPMTADELLDPSQRTRAEEAEEKVTTVQQCIDAITMFLPVGMGNAVLSHELRKWVMGAVHCSERTYKSAHARLDFGRSWQVDLPDGTKGMMVWRPDPDVVDDESE